MPGSARGATRTHLRLSVAGALAPVTFLLVAASCISQVDAASLKVRHFSVANGLRQDLGFAGVRSWISEGLGFSHAASQEATQAVAQESATQEAAQWSFADVLGHPAVSQEEPEEKAAEPAASLDDMFANLDAEVEQEEQVAKKKKPFKRKEPPVLLVGIYSAPTQEGADRRKEVRDTYWKHRFFHRGGPAVAKFVVGWSDKDDEGTRLLNADTDARPKDFIIVDVKESYFNLTQKTLQFFRWAALKSEARFVLKMDDDTFPHIEASVNYLRQQTGDYLHLGLMFPCAPVLKFTKWAEYESVWNHTFFPKYMQGSGYFVTNALAKEIAVTNYDKSKARMLSNEDAAVGLWIELLRWEDPNIEIEQHGVPATLSGCQPTDLLSMNNMLGYMSCYWSRHTRGEKDVCCNGPLNALTQSLLQVRAKVKMRTRCYGE